MVIVFFICLIRLAAVEMALHGAVSQTVRQAAANIRPVELALSQAEEHLPSTDDIPSLASLPGIDAVADKLAQWLPSPAGALLKAGLTGDWKPVQDAAATEIGRSVVEPLLRREADTAMLDPDLLKLYSLSLPDLKGGEDPYLRIGAEYTFKLGFPFTKQSIALRQQAEERVWISDAVPAPRGDGETEGQANANIQIVSILPDPLRPGNTARLTVLTDPGASLDLSVRYKSGLSQAKHLGEATADSDGKLEWTWLVSGNTTPGVWELTVTAADGTSVSRHFVVRKKGAEQPSD